MIRKSILFLLLALAALTNLPAQQRACATHEHLLQQLQEDPGFQDRLDALERHTEQYIQNGAVRSRTVVTIPVVVHVVWNVNAENLTDQQIQSQIDVLNEDFRKLNADVANTPAEFAPLAADCEINFCLAQRDPSGNATTGIVRRQTQVTSFSTNNAVKFFSQGGSDIWDRNQYLNIWVCDLGSGLLGYAQFPGGQASTDGVVCDYAYFGRINASAPYDKGRTATHEVGHWLNLRHIWGDATCGSDLVSDTPVHNTSNGGCPAYPHYSTCNGQPLEMTMNYMDYTYDACMYMFSIGQSDRMQAVLAPNGARYSLVSSQGCVPPAGGNCGAPTGLNATNITQIGATLNWGSVSGASSYNLQWKPANGNTWTTVSGLTATSYALTGLTAGTSYNYQVQAVCSGGSGNYAAAATFTTQSANNCTDPFESNNSRSTAKNITPGTAINALIGTSTDVDYFQFTVTSSNRNIKINLTNLPFDYDLRLWRNNSSIAISQNDGVAPEQIIYNSAPTSGTYYAHVYGYNGAFSSTQCYNLLVSLSGSAWRTDGTTDGEVEVFEVPVRISEGGFLMFPNPANDALVIELPAESEGDAQVALSDAAGRLVLQHHQNIAKGSHQINLELGSLSNGVYFVQLRNGANVFTRKLVVQH